jgi:lysophospholipase L1-like esterase
VKTRHAHNAPLLVGSIALTLAAAELALRLAFPVPDPYERVKALFSAPPMYILSSFEPNLSLTLRTEEGLPGMRQQPTKFSVNNLGFRGDSLISPKPPNEFRVFMVGGSTTESLYLDDSEAITSVLQDLLNRSCSGCPRIKVYGAGKSGDKSFDHVAMVAHRIVHLEPDMIIVFGGINDLLAAIQRRDYLFFDVAKAAPSEPSFTLFLKYAATEFQLPRLAYLALKPKSDQQLLEQLQLTSNYRELVRLTKSYPMAGMVPRTDIAPYKENLESIVGIAHAHDVKLVLMTQATSWSSKVDPRAKNWHWMTFGDGVAYPEEWMDRAMEANNTAMREVASHHNVPLSDFAKLIPNSTAYFYDDVHFNVNGAETAAKMLAEFISEEGMIGSPSDHATSRLSHSPPSVLSTLYSSHYISDDVLHALSGPDAHGMSRRAGQRMPCAGKFRRDPDRGNTGSTAMRRSPIQ